MQKRINQFLVFMTVSAVVLTSFINPKTAYADDGTNTGGGTSEPVVGEDQPVVEETPPAEVGDEPAPAEAAPADAEAVAAIIDQIPEGTDLVVVTEDGVEPLASQAAAQAILEGDPMWCPDGATPGDATCTSGYSTFQQLIDALTLDNGTNFSGNGVIWVAGTYSNADNSPIVFDGSLLTSLGNLQFTGGWSGANDTTVVSSDLADLDVSLSILNWTGNVTLSNLNIDADDAAAGLSVQTSGNITLNNIFSSGNALGLGADLNTCMFDGVQCTGTGDVTVNDSTFDNNDGGSGIVVDSGGTITLDTVQANVNGQAGAVLYNHDLLGTGDVQVSDSLFNANGDNGIYVYAEDDITLTNTDATNNGFDGADLLNYAGTGNVTVNNGDFSGNDDAGLYIISAGDVDVSAVTSNDNNNGAIIFADDGTGDVSVSGSDFSDNSWTGLQVTSAGNITLDNVNALNNGIGGLYLNALAGSGNISVDTGQFNGNSEYGIHAFANGDITLDNVMVNGLGTYTTEGGAWLKSFDGNVFVSNSIFTNNLEYGLLAVAAESVQLVNVTATFNGGNGVEAYSIYSFACFGNDNILVNVDSGVYTDNGGYGIYAYPGESGSLALSNAPIFSPTDNALGDTFVEALSNPCPKDPDPKPDEDDGKETNVIDVPEDGTSGPVEQDCETYSSTTFKLHSGTSVELDCPFDGNGQVTDTRESDLPDDLPVGLTFADAVTVGLDSDGNPLTVLDDGLITLTFKIPEELIGKHLSILYWDPTAKDGQGDWIELPFEQFGGTYFPLHPQDPDDGRLLCSGFSQYDDMVTVTVNFPGTFVLVAR